MTGRRSTRPNGQPLREQRSRPMLSSQRCDVGALPSSPRRGGREVPWISDRREATPIGPRRLSMTTVSARFGWLERTRPVRYSITNLHTCLQESLVATMRCFDARSSTSHLPRTGLNHRHGFSMHSPHLIWILQSEPGRHHDHCPSCQFSRCKRWLAHERIGREGGIRTPDPLLPKQVR